MTDTLSSWLETVVPMFRSARGPRPGGPLSRDEAWAVRCAAQESVERCVQHALREDGGAETDA